jgi:tetratricopeptide (TPR) repeat protein
MTGAKPGKIITFYSYKGGTGRTMALANTAWIMAAAGRRVLVVDWDLEAPGLDRFFHPFLGLRKIRNTPGVLDLIVGYVHAVTDVCSGTTSWFHDDKDRRALWIKERAAIGHALTPLAWSFPDGGRLDYMSAGRQNREYNAAFSAFHWDTFHEDQYGGQFLDALREGMRRDYDYVLIDSRTGLSDIADICTGQLPDVLVNCFTLNDQSIDGAAAVARRVKEFQPGGRTIRIVPVPMRVEDAEADRLDTARAKVRHKFAQFVTSDPGSPGGEAEFQRYLGSVEIPYKSAYAYEEVLATFRDVPGIPTSLLAAFERLTARITDGDVTGFDPLPEEQRHRYLEAFTRRRPLGPTQVLLSYVREDRMWAEWIGSVLVQAGFGVRYTEFGSGDGAGAPLADEAERQIESAHRIVMVLSAAYQNAPQARALWESVAARDPMGALNSLVAVRVSAARLYDPFARRTLVDLSTQDESGARTALLRGMKVDPQEHPADAARSGPRYPGTLPPVWRVGHRNATFIGRTQLLDDLNGKLRESRGPVVVRGMAGVGKTQLALEYAHRFKSEYDVVWWLRADQPGTARQDYADLHRPLLGLAAPENISLTVEAVRDALRRGSPHRRWLLVFDNADDPKALEPLLVSGGDGHTVITTRHEGWEEIAEPLLVDVFDRRESVEYLTRQTPSMGQRAADAVAGVLGDLPLAVEQAAVSLNRSGLDAAAYLERVEQEINSPQINAQSTDRMLKAVAAACEISIKLLRAQSPAAVRLLELCAFFGAGPISRALLLSKEAVAALREHSRGLDETSVVQEAISRLTRFALAKEDTNRSLQVHRLVQATVRSSLSADEQETNRRIVASVLAGAPPADADVDNPDNWPRYEAIWPHLTAPWIAESLDTGIRRVTVARMRYLRARGELDDAMDLGRECVESWTRPTGEADRWTLNMQFEIATVLLYKGHYPEALELAQDVMDRQHLAFGEEDPHTLMTAGTLTAVLRGMGRFEKALRVDRETCSRLGRVFGEEDPRTLTAANNLAVSLRMTGDCFAARQVDQDTLRVRRTRLGSSHPLTIASEINLGRDLRSCGDYAGSLDVLRNAYERAQKRSELGIDYPLARSAATALAVTLRRTGQLDEALELTQQVLASCRRQLGDRAPETLSVWLGLAGHWSAKRGFTEARDLLGRLLTDFGTVLGESHPNTIACAANYSVQLNATGQLQQARAEAERARFAFEQLLGPDHPFMLSCLVNLANAEAALGDVEDAETHYRAAHAGLSRTLGAEHASTLVCAADLALLLRRTGRDEEGAHLHRESLDRLSAALGSTHTRVVLLRDGDRVGLELDPHPI